MALKLYKPGQGYYTRLTSNIGGGVLVVAGAVWVMDQLKVIQADWRIILQGAFLVAIIAVFGWLLFRAAWTSPRTGDFLISTEGEMKKVNWPARREVTGSTWVVVGTVVVLTVLLFAADLVFSNFFQLIGVLER